MAKVVRLKGHEQREWNSNVSILVNNEGRIIRRITDKESMTMFQLSKHVAKNRQSVTVETPEEGSKVEARLEVLPKGAILVRFYIDGLVVVGGREAMKARILAEHGECILYRTNGKFLCAVRDPNIERPSAEEAQKTTPNPDICICKDWAGRVPGKHHPICQHNDKAPVAERGELGALTVSAPTSETSVLPPQPKATVPPPESPLAVGTVIPGLGTSKPVKKKVTASASSTPNVPAPEACVCKGWALPDGVTNIDRTREHHPICQYKDKYVAPPEEKTEPENASPTEPPKSYIIDIDSGTALREAEKDEIKQAEQNDGVLIIDGKAYGVVNAIPEDELPEDS